MSEEIAAAIKRSEDEVRTLLDRRDVLRIELDGIEAALTRIAEWRAQLDPAAPSEESEP